MVTIEVGVDGDGLVLRLGQDHSVADWEPTVLPAVLPWPPQCRDHGCKPPHLTVICFLVGGFFPSPNCLLRSREERLSCLPCLLQAA